MHGDATSQIIATWIAMVMRSAGCADVDVLCMIHVMLNTSET